MTTTPIDLKVLMNHIYEYQKGVRQMILFTCTKRYKQAVTDLLNRRNINYILQEAGKNNINVYFGRQECIEVIRLIINRPLNMLSPEEDFILGTMLGYDICAQCQRYCKQKHRKEKTNKRNDGKVLINQA